MYLIQDTTLVDIADAIRNKTGDTGLIAVNDIASKIDEIGIYTYKNNFSNSIGSYEYQSLHSLCDVSFPKATSIGKSAFSNCNNLTTASFPLVTSVSDNAFSSCLKLTSVSLESAETIGSYAFQDDISLTNVSLPVCNSIGSYAFHNCSNLKSVVFPNVTAVINTNGNTDMFLNTPIANGTGYIYVPDSLVSSFKTETNWSTYASQIKPLSEYVEVEA